MIAKKTINYVNNKKKKNDEDKKYYPKPGEQQKKQPNYSPNPDKEKSKGNYRELRREDNLFEYFKDYKYRINWDNSVRDTPLEDVAEVRLTTKDNQKYYADFVAKDFIKYVFDKNKKTGECANGTYFCIPNMILVEKINEENVKKTIDSLIENLEIKDYFKKIH